MIANVTDNAAGDTFDRLAACRICAERFAATVSGHAPRPILRLDPAAPILIVSQAPGWRAHRSGIPFDDPSGARLRDWMGLDARRFFARGTLSIAPMGFCFPGHDAAGGDLPPPAICRETWHADILAALTGVRITLVIGGLAQRHMLGAGRMTDRVRGWRKAPRNVWPLPHPSWRNTPWLRRNPWFETELLPALREEVAKVLDA